MLLGHCVCFCVRLFSTVQIAAEPIIVSNVIINNWNNTLTHTHTCTARLDSKRQHSTRNCDVKSWFKILFIASNFFVVLLSNRILSLKLATFFLPKMLLFSISSSQFLLLVLMNYFKKKKKINRNKSIAVIHLALCSNFFYKYIRTM